MEKTTLIGLGIVALALLVAGCASTSQQPPQQQPTQQTYDVEIRGFAFTPATLTVKAGDTIRWTNYDDVGHTVKFEFKESNLLMKGDSYSYTFNEKGTFNYECGPHPRMKGTVTVT